MKNLFILIAIFVCVWFLQKKNAQTTNVQVSFTSTVFYSKIQNYKFLSPNLNVFFEIFMPYAQIIL